MKTLTTVVRALTLMLAAILPGLTGPDAIAQCGGRWLTSPEQQTPLGLDATVFALSTLPSGDLVAGGQFTTAGGAPASRIARWSGSSWAPLGSGMNNTVGAFTVLPGGDLVAGGAFDTAGGVSANFIARWNGASWAPLGSGVSGGNPNRVFAVAYWEEPIFFSRGVYAAGLFANAGGTSANNIADWDPDLSRWFPLGGGIIGGPLTFVNALIARPNGDVVAGGLFTTAGGVAANNIARWSPSNGSWAPLGSGMDGGSVRALAVQPNGHLVAGGFFTTAGGVAANRIALWNGSAWSPLGAGMDGNVNAIAVLPNGDIVAGGAFTTAGGVAANNIARWNGTEWAPLGAGMNGGLNALAVLQSGELVAGGVFTAAGGVPSGYWARWTDTGIPWIAQQPLAQSTSVNGSASFTATPASGYDFSGPLTYQWRRNGVNIANGATANGTVISGATAATLNLANISILDSGRYSCVVSNSCGNATSTGVFLTVGSSSCPGDANGDGSITFADLNAVLSAFGQSVATPGTGGDVTGDGAVTFADLNTVLSAFGTGC